MRPSYRFRFARAADFFGATFFLTRVADFFPVAAFFFRDVRFPAAVFVAAALFAFAGFRLAAAFALLAFAGFRLAAAFALLAFAGFFLATAFALLAFAGFRLAAAFALDGRFFADLGGAGRSRPARPLSPASSTANSSSRATNRPPSTSDDRSSLSLCGASPASPIRSRVSCTTLSQDSLPFE
jgi:hypothetical protein